MELAKLSLSAFSDINRGMSIETILQRLGKPRRATQMGAHVLEYALADGSRVEVLYVHPQLIKIVHYRGDGTKMSWIPQEEKLTKP